MYKLISFMLILMLISLPLSIVKAESVEIKIISESPFYDSSPKIYGENIVWRRAKNQNENNFVDLSEASWIMVYNINSRKTYNITPIETYIYKNKYHHAQSPSVYQNKILYEAQINGNSSDAGLFLYDILTKDTIQLNPPNIFKPNGHFHMIYGDWIFYTSRVNNKRFSYVYNYITDVHRTINGRPDPYSLYGAVMDDQKIILTMKHDNNSFSIWNYNINTNEKIKILEQNSTLLCTSVYKNKIGLTNTTDRVNWSVAIFDLDQNKTIMTKNNSLGILINENNIIIANQTGRNSIMHQGNKTYMINATKIMRLSDMYGNNVIWMDNKYSPTNFGNARDNFDISLRIYESTEQVIKKNIYYSIPVIIVAILAVILFIVKRKEQYGE